MVVGTQRGWEGLTVTGHPEERRQCLKECLKATKARQILDEKLIAMLSHICNSEDVIKDIQILKPCRRSHPDKVLEQAALPELTSLWSLRTLPLSAAIVLLVPVLGNGPAFSALLIATRWTLSTTALLHFLLG